MLKELEQLLILQDRDRKMRTLRQELKVAPLERKQMEEKVAGSLHRLESAKQKTREIEVQRNKLEIEVKSKREQIAKYQVQKFQTRKNEEFQAMTTAVEHLERDIKEIEDRELEFMDSSEQLKPEIQEADKAAQATKAQVARQQVDLDAKIAAIEQQLKGLEAERAVLAEAVEEDLLYQYDRLFANKGGAAVVGLEHDTCTGCHMKVTASTAARTKAGREVVDCEQCGRILYWSPS